MDDVTVKGTPLSVEEMETEISKPTEGLSSIADGLSAMMGMYMKKPLKDLEMRYGEIQVLVKSSLEELREKQKNIQVEISESLEEPKGMIQEFLDTLSRLETKNIETETRSQASMDELKRDISDLRGDISLLRGRHERLVESLKKIGE